MVGLLTEGPTVEDVPLGAGEAIRIKVAEVEVVLVVAAGDLDGYVGSSLDAWLFDNVPNNYQVSPGPEDPRAQVNLPQGLNLIPNLLEEHEVKITGKSEQFVTRPGYMDPRNVKMFPVITNHFRLVVNEKIVKILYHYDIEIQKVRPPGQQGDASRPPPRVNREDSYAVFTTFVRNQSGENGLFWNTGKKKPIIPAFDRAKNFYTVIPLNNKVFPQTPGSKKDFEVKVEDRPVDHGGLREGAIERGGLFKVRISVPTTGFEVRFNANNDSEVIQALNIVVRFSSLGSKLTLGKDALFIYLLFINLLFIYYLSIYYIPDFRAEQNVSDEWGLSARFGWRSHSLHGKLSVGQVYRKWTPVDC